MKKREDCYTAPTLEECFVIPEAGIAASGTGEILIYEDPYIQYAPPVGGWFGELE